VESLEDSLAGSARTHAVTEIWICTVGDERLVIRCAQNELTWHEARSYAAKKLCVEPDAVKLNRSTERAAVEVRWVGDDYAHGGTPGGRRLQEREPGGKWVDV
jgi:hypothetical protein